MVNRIITAKQVTLVFTVISTFFSLIGGVCVYLNTVWGGARLHQYHIKFFVEKFDLDGEGNIASYYQGIALLVCAFLLLLISWDRKQKQDRFIWEWRVLACIFLFLSIDEIAMLHEMTIDVLREGLHTRGMFYFAWVIPASICIFSLGIMYLRFWWNLPARTRWLLLAAAFIYLGGAIGMEMVGGYFADKYGLQSVQYITGTILEESLEMFGITLFIHTLTDYLETHVKGIWVEFDWEAAQNKTNSASSALAQSQS